jgi:hypothetical protein
LVPAKVFLTRIWPGCRVGTGALVVYSKTEGGPVLGVRIAAIVVGGFEVDMLREVVVLVVVAWRAMEGLRGKRWLGLEDLS